MPSIIVLASLAWCPAAGAGCPPRAILDTLARATWDGPSGHPRCTAIRADEALVLVVDAVSFDGKPLAPSDAPPVSGGRGYAAIVGGGDAVRWQATWDDQVPGDWKHWWLVDLDGDGHDELLEHDVHEGHMGYSSAHLTVHTITSTGAADGPTLALVDSIPRVDEGNSCSSTYRIVRGRHEQLIEVTGTRDTNPKFRPALDAVCPLAGRHLYRWTNDDLVEKH